ncbi:hypothetical protein P872_09085 [Rhodonellum psychrophilum GCM71 = DSM 17998]|uniref:Glycosyltransferase 2-like domain-containing protein n=3 Tax=Cytophagaceae TaxID=89373 RepID=U5BTK3_9BACT|nr:glycosyltransferase family 2 protein [Rhodonellum ikkaensis]ERM81238.1 hypothetical protein P872_09085 [Rhodonellum psychrophilum GCM71 = DSM 17998]SDZ32597.1 Glycosyltransferase, catalytic subunit of cellulose synthase and poly-beta-1,6-N-acetylglucosamine synthase [Rhodonellum ikkaensis]
MVEILFWIGVAIVFYTFIGYGIFLYILLKFKNNKEGMMHLFSDTYHPEVTLVIPCFNESDILDEKIQNCLDLIYAPELLEIIFITDGSTDNFREVIGRYPRIKLLHDDARKGKTAAENRAMTFVKSPIVIFSDANTMLNKEAVKNIVRHFENEKVGCVSGEKKVLTEERDGASSAGEGLYWKYESFLKKMDSDFHSAVGAAGELVAFRCSEYEDLPENTILDDFMQSLLIASKGFKIVYEPEAYALEKGSASIKEEYKRKKRISSGGWQSVQRLWDKITLSKDPKLYFQYISHRVLRWTVTPFLLILLFLLNIFLLDSGLFYQLFMLGQVVFYLMALIGWYYENKQIKVKLFFVPFYFTFMNYSAITGFLLYMKGNQSGVWEKAARKA